MEKCRCGIEPILCQHDQVEYLRSLRIYDSVRYFRCVCPKCHEWATSSKSESGAKRFWKLQMIGKRNPYWHNADIERHAVWRNAVTDEIVIDSFF